MCSKCRIGYSYSLNSDGVCGDLSYLKGRDGLPCDGELVPMEWAPTYTAFDYNRAYSIWCVACRKWHTHSSSDGHRIAHCHKDGVHENGYFIEACRDRRAARSTVKAVNVLEASRFKDSRAFREAQRECTVDNPSEGQHQIERISMAQLQRRKVRLFKSGDSMGIQTTATTADEFWREFSKLLAELIEAGSYESDWEFQLIFWLPQAFECAARLKGYKADVQEERVIYAGAAFLPESADVTPREEALPEVPVEELQ